MGGGGGGWRSYDGVSIHERERKKKKKILALARAAEGSRNGFSLQWAAAEALPVVYKRRVEKVRARRRWILLFFFFSMEQLDMGDSIRLP